MTSNLPSQLTRLRCEARELAAAEDWPALTATLHEINRVRVLAEWPERVKERGMVHPVRYG